MNTVHTEEHHEFTIEAQRQQHLLTAVSRCCNTSPIKHVGERAPAVHAIIAALRAQGYEFRFTDRFWVILEKQGVTANLQTAVEQVLLTDPSIGDRESVAEQVRAGAIDIGAKSDLKTVKEKTDFIEKHGIDAWSRLPAKRENALDMNPATMGRKDWNRLTVEQKVAIQKSVLQANAGNLRITEVVLGEILKRP
jgi:hypothetical protein